MSGALPSGTGLGSADGHSGQTSCPDPSGAIPSAWTPGPWHVAYDDHNGQAVVSSAHTEIATCWHHCVGSIEREMRANAPLIAAAPELYAALERAREWLGIDCSPDDLAWIEAALAKARGEQVQA